MAFVPVSEQRGVFAVAVESERLTCLKHVKCHVIIGIRCEQCCALKLPIPMASIVTFICVGHSKGPLTTYVIIKLTYTGFCMAFSHCAVHGRRGKSVRFKRIYVTIYKLLPNEKLMKISISKAQRSVHSASFNTHF